ncbi:hypothetical protein AeMF1_018861 [Aphanomyces euteiches]|nr:hypothetical protein AeMF1_018861 [Aphanomyces euteiches]
MRHYRIESPYPRKNPELFARVRECIRRRSVLGPWKKVCLERRRQEQEKQALESPNKDTTNKTESETPEESTSAPAVDPLLAQKKAEVKELETKLEELLEKKHIQFGLLKAILIEEARAKAKPPISQVPEPNPAMPPQPPTS